MIYQTDKRLNSQIQSWGCYFRSLQGIAEFVSKKTLTAIQINGLYFRGWQEEEKQWNGEMQAPMESNCYVNYPHKIISQAFTELGLDFQCTQIGANKKNRGKSPTFWDSVVSSLDFSYDYQIQWYKEGLSFSHAVLADRHGRVIFNPDPMLELKGVPEVELWRIR